MFINLFKMSNKTYDILKWIALVVIPAICVLYTAVGEIWTIPNVTKVVATIVAFNTCLGTILGISSSNYKKNNTQ